MVLKKTQGFGRLELGDFAKNPIICQSELVLVAEIVKFGQTKRRKLPVFERLELPLDLDVLGLFIFGLSLLRLEHLLASFHLKRPLLPFLFQNFHLFLQVGNFSLLKTIHDDEKWCNLPENK